MLPIAHVSDYGPTEKRKQSHRQLINNGNSVIDSCLAGLQSRTNSASMLQLRFLQAVNKLRAKSSGM